jgi:hypothetical protein
MKMPGDVKQPPDERGCMPSAEQNKTQGKAVNRFVTVQYLL